MTTEVQERKHSPRWQGLKITGRTNDANVPIPGDPIIVNCYSHVEEGLCDDCAEDFERVLSDLPHLLEDLDIAVAGFVRFVEHGHRGDSVESASSGSNPAVTAASRLQRAIIDGLADWFDTRNPFLLVEQFTPHMRGMAFEPSMPKVARDISMAASKAHRVIDRPADLVYYGACPACEKDIWQERVHAEDTETKITCRSCDYAKPLDEHNKAVLPSLEDHWMTINELVQVLTSADRPVTTNQVKGWIYSDRNNEGVVIAREQRNRPRWVDGQLRENLVWTYRLGEVRELAEKNDRRKRERAS